MIKLASWNVNGMRACYGRGDFDSAFQRLGADIFCIQETKMERGQAEIEYPGYEQYWNSAKKKGYSGTAVFTRLKPERASYGIGLDEHDQEGRIVLLEYSHFFLINMYTPNSQGELARLPYRMRWEDDVRAWITGLEAEGGKPVVLCGDLNVAHEDIDLKHPKTNHRNAGFTDEERGKFSDLLGAGYCDTFRHFNPDARDVYTWWSYIGKSREKNVGWRIDYFIVSASLVDKVVDTAVYMDLRGSDHCPVGLTLDLPASS
ncbi:MAG: exodeoxyribonuclease III [Oscillospiraceae bacterium]|nr:exodeoxyribonuclease III [Oscillospiraceae bacterium]